MGFPMLPTPMNPTFTASQRVQLEHVVPQDLLLALVAQRQREEAIHGLRILGVAVWVIGGGDEVVVARGLDDVLHGLIVALHSAIALTTNGFCQRHYKL